MPLKLRRQQVGWWSGHANPTTGPTGTASTWVGNLVQFTAPGRVFGLQFFDGTGAGEGQYSYGVLLPDSPTHVDRAKMVLLYMTPGQVATWQHAWFSKPLRVTTGRDYRLAFMYLGGGFFRTNAALASAVTRNQVQFKFGFQTTSLDISGAGLTSNTNANAVDVLFQPD